MCFCSPRLFGICGCCLTEPYMSRAQWSNSLKFINSTSSEMCYSVPAVMDKLRYVTYFLFNRLSQLTLTQANVNITVKCWHIIPILQLIILYNNNVMLELEQECGGLWAVGGYLTPVGVVKEKTFIYPLFACLSLKDNICGFLAVKSFWYSLGLQCRTIEICCFPGWGIFKPLTACSWRSWSHAVRGSSTFFPERLAWSWWSRPPQR